MENIFDAHAHYDDDWFDEDREELLSTLPQKGISGIVNASVDLKTAEIAKGFAQKYDYMYFTVGFHPENLTDMPENYLEQIAEMLRHEKAVALGEIGLDYHWEIERGLQHRAFDEQLKLAIDLDVPVVVHDREAHGDVMEYLRKYKPKGLLHCFSGSVEMLKEVLKLGMSISLGGTVTFKNARVPVEVAQFVPLDRLLLETDAPYLSPVPFRGKRNDSSNIIYTAQKIAEIKGVGVQELLDITSHNARELYGIKD